MPRRSDDRFARAIAAGARRGALVYATVTAVMAWGSVAETVLPTGGPVAVLESGLAVLVLLGGGAVLAVPPRRRGRIGRIALGVALMEGGFVAYLLTARLDPHIPHSTSSFSLSLLKIAIVVFGTTAGRRRAPVIVATLGGCLAELACVLVGPGQGYPWTFDGPALAALLIIVSASIGFAVARRRGARARRDFDRLEARETAGLARALVRSQAAAVVHDTVLNDLAVLATTESGALSDRLAAHLAATLRLLASPDWVPKAVDAGEPGTGEIVRAVELARIEGMDVRLDGDLGALPGLGAVSDRALGLALAQCLTNTRRHASTTEAEVTVIASDDEVSVMVTDAGDGFDPDDIGRDRMGIRGSVQDRIEAVGGRVRIFAKPGLGTSIVLTAPRGAAGAEVLG